MTGQARTRRGILERLFGLGAVLLLVGSASAQQVPRQGREGEGFSAAERARLEAGELVTRRVARRRGQLRLIGGNAWQVVDRPVDTTWRTLCDEASYGNILPAIDEAHVVSHAPGERVVTFRHAVGFVSARYSLRMRYDHERHDISFSLDQQRPSDLRAAWGFLGVTPFEDDDSRSLVSWGVMADPGGGMLGGMVRGQIHDWMLRVPETIRQYMLRR